MVWNDEFNGTALDVNKWQYETGLLRNQEAQYYTTRPENVRLESGNLVIEARRESYNGSSYTAGSIENKNRAGWIYGRIEVRAQVPTGIGMWPAIWMLGNGPGLGWPRQGEIDIMEHVGFEPGIIHGTIHCGAYNHVIGTQRGATTPVPTLATAFHLYRVEWWNNRIEFFVDSTRYFTFNKDVNATLDQWPFDMQEYLKLNVAVGGSWGGQQGINVNIFPQRMLVDYARVYQWDNSVPLLRPRETGSRQDAGKFAVLGFMNGRLSILSGNKTHTLSGRALPLKPEGDRP